MAKFQFFARSNNENNKHPISIYNIFWGLKTILVGLMFIIVLIFDKNIFELENSDRHPFACLIAIIFKEYSWIFYLILGTVFIRSGYLDIFAYYRNKPKGSNY